MSEGWTKLIDQVPPKPGTYLCFGYHCFYHNVTEQFVGTWDGKCLDENHQGGEFIATHWKPLGPDPKE